MILNILLFDGFETLDVFGPVEVFGSIPESYTIKYLSLEGGLIKSWHGALVETQSIDSFSEGNTLFIPGGFGTRPLVDDENYVNLVKDLCDKSKYCLTVCTGSALLAKTGLLNGLEATSNKMSFRWVMSVQPQVKWQKRSRWAVDGKYWTSSGVSAGIDMALSFVEKMNGRDEAIKVVGFMEYLWNEDKNNDPFSVE